jgi:hypothetical protein
MDILDITQGPTFDETIWEKEYHTHNPYASSKLNNNDEIRIPIQQQDIYTLPSESYLYIEGRVTKKDGNAGSTVPFINNPMAYLFDEIRYEISGVTVDSTKKVGISSTLKGFASLSPSEKNLLAIAGWVAPDKETITPDTTGNFDFYVPLKLLLGFAEDYRRIIINVKQELVLLRSSNDKDCIKAGAGATDATLDWKLILDKIVWRVPHVRLNDEHRITLLRKLKSDRDIVMPFRSWEFHEYPVLPSTQRHTWSVKTSTHLEKARYVIFGLQTKRRSILTANAGEFDHCKLTNCKVFLNSQFYPYDNINISFDKNRYSVLYDMYARFQSSYYGKTNTPLLSPQQFATKAPIVIIDCSKQNESVKSSSVDIKIDMEFNENIPEDTSAYCLILHDKIVTYTPLTGIVKTIL